MGVGRWAKRLMATKRYKIPVIKEISRGDVTYRIGDTVYDNTVITLHGMGSCCCSVTQLCPILRDPWAAACQASLSFTIS